MSPTAPRDSARRALGASFAAALAVVALTLGGPVPAAAQTNYILMPRAELLDLPTRGAAWDFVVQVASSAWTAPELDDQDSKTNVQALAAALVYARTGDTDMRAKARRAIVAMLPTYDLSQDAGLGPARQLSGWVLVADLIGLDGAEDTAFRALLRRALSLPIGTHTRWGKSLTVCQEDSDNNWGAWCGASRIAAALYLGDASELDRAARVVRGFLGDRSSWSGFRGEGSKNGLLTSATRSWSCDAAPDAYVPTNPDCGDRAGAFPSDAGRSGAYSVLDAMYQSETTAGIVLSTELLYRNGYGNAWGFRGSLARIASFDHRHGAWNLGRVQTSWPWLVNARLGTSYPTVTGAFGRSLAFGDWLYGPRSGGGGDPVVTPKPTPVPTPTPTPTPTPDPTQRTGPKQTAKPGYGNGGGTSGTTSQTDAGAATAAPIAVIAGAAGAAGTPAQVAQTDAGSTPGGRDAAKQPRPKLATEVAATATKDDASQSSWLLAKVLLALVVLGAAFRLMRTIARRDPDPGGRRAA